VLILIVCFLLQGGDALTKTAMYLGKDGQGNNSTPIVSTPPTTSSEEPEASRILATPHLSGLLDVVNPNTAHKIRILQEHVIQVDGGAVTQGQILRTFYVPYNKKVKYPRESDVDSADDLPLDTNFGIAITPVANPLALPDDGLGSEQGWKRLKAGFFQLSTEFCFKDP